MSVETAIRPEAIAASLVGLDVVVSPFLPMTPSPGEDARRIVRHGFAAARAELGRASLFPDSLGDVGPRPGDPTRALQVGRILFVDQELDREIAARGLAAFKREQAASRARARERVELAVVAQILNVPRVVAYVVDHRIDETLYRIPKGEDLAGDWAAEVWIRHEDLRRAGDTWQRRAYIANRLRQVMIDQRLDDEEAGRGR